MGKEQTERKYECTTCGFVGEDGEQMLKHRKMSGHLFCRAAQQDKITTDTHETSWDELLDWTPETTKKWKDYMEKRKHNSEYKKYTSGESEPSQPFNKYDNGKQRLDLVPPAIIEAVGEVRTYGIKKYGDSESWKTVEPERYRAAMMRHLCAYLRDPESIDEESGINHLHHAACNIAFLLEMEKEKNK